MRLAFTLLLSLTAVPLAAATVYKWRDASGQVHYSQIAPPTMKAADAKVDGLKPGVIMQPTAVPKPLQSAADAAADQKAGAAQTTAAPETPEAKTKRCTEAETRLSFLVESTARRLLVAQPDGSRARMSEEEFEQNLNKARDAGKGC